MGTSAHGLGARKGRRGKVGSLRSYSKTTPTRRTCICFWAWRSCVCAIPRERYWPPSGRSLSIPEHIDARTFLAWIELEVRGDVDAAIKEYRKSDRAPTRAARSLYQSRGWRKNARRAYSEAIVSFNKALELKPKFGAALNNARLDSTPSRTNGAQARGDFEEALKIDPQDRGALYRTGAGAGEENGLRRSAANSRRAQFPLAQFRLLAGMGQNRSHSILVDIALGRR